MNTNAAPFTAPLAGPRYVKEFRSSLADIFATFLPQEPRKKHVKFALENQVRYFDKWMPVESISQDMDQDNVDREANKENGNWLNVALKGSVGALKRQPLQVKSALRAPRLPPRKADAKESDDDWIVNDQRRNLLQPPRVPRPVPEKPFTLPPIKLERLPLSMQNLHALRKKVPLQCTHPIYLVAKKAARQVEVEELKSVFEDDDDDQDEDKNKPALQEEEDEYAKPIVLSKITRLPEKAGSWYKTEMTNAFDKYEGEPDWLRAINARRLRLLEEKKAGFIPDDRDARAVYKWKVADAYLWIDKDVEQKKVEKKVENFEVVDVEMADAWTMDASEVTAVNDEVINKVTCEVNSEVTAVSKEVTSEITAVDINKVVEKVESQAPVAAPRSQALCAPPKTDALQRRPRIRRSTAATTDAPRRRSARLAGMPAQ